MNRYTETGTLLAGGHQFKNWSLTYRVFSKQRIDIHKIIAISQADVLKETAECGHIIAYMDRTLIKKKGENTQYRMENNPLGPPFLTNFICGQRFIMVLLAWGKINGSDSIFEIYSRGYCGNPIAKRVQKQEQRSLPKGFTLICSGWETGYRIAGVFVGMRYVKKMNWVKTLRNPAPNFAPIADKQIMIIIKIIIICTPA